MWPQADPGNVERDALLSFLEVQRAALRRSVLGLTDEQARRRPSASDLSLAALLKHTAVSVPAWMPVLRGEGGDWTRWEGDDDFVVHEHETLDHLLDVFDRSAKEFDTVVRSLPGVRHTVPIPKNAFGLPGPERSVRWVLLHLITEVAQHAGHADIIRESLDGATAFHLMNVE